MRDRNTKLLFPGLCDQAALDWFLSLQDFSKTRHDGNKVPFGANMELVSKMHREKDLIQNPYGLGLFRIS